jgi:tRNA (guanine-N7-)-methyltransferase
LGIDILPVVIRYARRRGNQRGLTNIRFAVGGGRQLLNEFVEPGSVDEIHCYHPQPYYERAEVHRRLITPEFLALVHRSLKANGLFVIQTDNPGYWKYIQKIVPIFFDFVEMKTPWPDTPQGRTRREIIARQRGLPVFRGYGRRRDDISADAAMKIAETLPPPVFDANRHLRALDRMERGSDK